MIGVKIRRRSQFPKCIRHFKEVRGICIGECVEKCEINKHHAAHAHCNHNDYPGWICLRRKTQLREKFTLLHEVAHIISCTSNNIPYHGKKWREVVVAIGGTYQSYKSYCKRYIYKDYSPRKRTPK
jgi:hypothetical protein